MTLQRLAVFVLLSAGIGCASAPVAPPAPIQSAACAAVSDTLSKYISKDALPLAQLAPNGHALRPPGNLNPNDTVIVEFLVRWDGTADGETIDIVGGEDPAFRSAVTSFAATNKFVPGQVDGCSVLSRYTVTFGPGFPRT